MDINTMKGQTKFFGIGLPFVQIRGTINYMNKSNKGNNNIVL